ncbi:hypothetical protein GSB9_00450 [Flavobacteriaceae bacterium GSB9]|nr:hypothetical protein GSB9_00450 [Flavobacteriaceae bacterium GSB9]
MKTNLLFLITLFLVAIGYSQTFPENFITYNVTSSNTVEITDYNNAGGIPVTIPSAI